MLAAGSREQKRQAGRKEGPIEEDDDVDEANVNEPNCERSLRVLALNWIKH